MIIPLRLVTNLEQNTNGYRSERFVYTYKNLLYHLHGRGIMGFMQTAVIHDDDANINKTTISTYKQNLELQHQLNLVELGVYNNCSNFTNPYSTATKQISKTTYDYSQMETVTGNAQIVFSHLSLTTEVDVLKGIKKITCYEYDNNGNLVHTAAQYAKNTANADDEYLESNQNLFAQYGTWLPSSLTITRSTQHRYNTNRQHITQTELFYNTKGMLHYTENFKNNLQYYYKEEFSYDRYGNLVSSGLDSANNPNPGLLRRKFYTYNSGKFMTQQTNALGHVTLLTYEPIYGNLVYSKANDGLETTMQYDGWGRLTQTNAPGNHITTHTLTYSNIYPKVYTKTVASTNLGDYVVTYFDTKNRKIREETVGFNGMVHAKHWEYDARGFLKTASNVYDAQNPNNIKLNTYTYDEFGRLKKINYDNQFDQVVYTYNGLETLEQLSDGQVKQTIIDATGTTESITDNGGTITYKYNGANKPIEITSNGHIINISYNIQMQKIKLSDLNTGIYYYDYNAFGELLAQKDPLGNEFRFDYDDLGRMVRKHNNNYAFSYTYYNDNGNGPNNKLAKEECRIAGAVTHQIDYTYNNNGLLTRTEELITSGNKTAITNYGYDAHFRLQQTQYPNITLQYHYDGNNNLQYIDDGNNQNLWTKNEVTSNGVTKMVTYGNGYITNHSFDNNHQLTSIVSQNGAQHAINMGYNFELPTGNLKERHNLITQQTEEFSYDNLNRLVNINGPVSYKNDYNASGNIININNAGSQQVLAYTSNKPYAANKHIIPDNLSPVMVPPASTDDHVYTYNELNKLANIKQLNLEYYVNYGLGEQRIESELLDNGVSNSHIYYLNSANMEVTQQAELTYLYAEGVPFAMHRKTASNNQLYYLHTDYQNSLLAITDNNGTVVEERNYDAWGRPRNPQTLAYEINPFQAGMLTLRGYTFHEHLIEFSLINMNARMYDPVLGRVISPDNYIQAPDNTQSFNRYSYCWNNPLKYTDPSGDVVVEGLIVAAAGFTVGYLSHGLTHGDWGKSAVIAGGITAAVATVGFFTGGAAVTAKSAAIYSGKFAANSAINSVIPQAHAQVGNVGVSIGVGVGFGSSGLASTSSLGLAYQNEDGTNVGVGFGGGENMLAWRGSAGYKGYGASYGRTYYGSAFGPDGVPNAQTVGQVGINAGKFSFRIENDFMGDGHDRWRSNAATISWGNWELGTNLRNNLQNEGIDEVDDFGEDLRGNINQDYGGKRYGKWKNGQTYSSPMWIGYRNGNNVTRVGYNHPIFQSLTQDVTHKHGFFGMPFGHANFFSNYGHFEKGGYSYSGYNNPYSLW